MRLSSRLACAASLILACAAAPASAADSAYTTLDFARCKQVIVEANRVEPGAEWYEARCPGYRDYPLYYTEVDLRVSIAYGQSHMDPGDAWGSFASFNHVHHTIEWRLHPAAGGVRPVATIHRWFVAPAEGGPDRQVLAVARVTQPGGPAGCTVGYVDANANRDANALARDVADTVAPGFVCGKERPRWYGATTAATPAAY